MLVFLDKTLAVSTMVLCDVVSVDDRCHWVELLVAFVLDHRNLVALVVVVAVMEDRAYSRDHLQSNIRGQKDHNQLFHCAKKL